MAWAEDKKYITFKRQDWEAWEREHKGAQGEGRPALRSPLPPPEIPDAVVIRMQDEFGPYAADFYSSMIVSGLNMMERMVPGGVSSDLYNRLSETSDYFHERAEEGFAQERKFPD